MCQRMKKNHIQIDRVIIAVGNLSQNYILKTILNTDRKHCNVGNTCMITIGDGVSHSNAPILGFSFHFIKS